MNTNATSTNRHIDRDRTHWFNLLELTRLCPVEVTQLCPVKVDDSISLNLVIADQVPAVTAKSKRKKRLPGVVIISGNTRLLLSIIAQHADGESGETFVARRTLMHETKMTVNTIDSAIANLKRAGLLGTRKTYDRSTGTFTNTWIIQRERLIDLVGAGIEDADLRVIVTSAKSGPIDFDCSAARIEQIRSRLFALAGAVRITIAEIKIPDRANKVTLRVAVEELTIPTKGEDANEPSTVDMGEIIDEPPKLTIRGGEDGTMNDFVDKVVAEALAFESRQGYGFSSLPVPIDLINSRSLIVDQIKLRVPHATVKVNHTGDYQSDIELSWNRPSKKIAA